MDMNNNKTDFNEPFMIDEQNKAIAVIKNKKIEWIKRSMMKQIKQLGPQLLNKCNNCIKTKRMTQITCCGIIEV